jgi:hypothetical protein
MLRHIFLSFVFVSLVSSCFGQKTQAELDAEKERSLSARGSYLQSDPKALDDALNVSKPRPENLSQVVWDKLEAKLKVSKKERESISELSKDRKLKVLKVWDDKCGDGKTVNANDPNCIEEGVFAIASHYSFNLREFTKSFASVGFLNNRVIANSSLDFSQILVDLGDSRIEIFDSDFQRLQDLYAVKIPETDRKIFNEQVKAGFLFRGMTFSDSTDLVLGHTYLVRSSFRRERFLGTELVDAIYAFRVVRQEGNVLTLVWKEVTPKR